MRCEYPNCDKEAEYSLFEYLPNLTKRWLQVCDWHDRIIAQHTRKVLMRFDAKEFKEIYVKHSYNTGSFKEFKEVEKC